MVSRSKAKIDMRVAELRLRYPHIQFKSVEADLSTFTSVASFRELVSHEIASLDVGVVCLNAGCCVEGPVDLVSDSEFERVFGLNGLHVVYLTKALLS